MSTIHPDNENNNEEVVPERGIPQVGNKRKTNKFLPVLVAGFVFVIAVALGVHVLLGKLANRNNKSGDEKAQMSPSLPDMTRGAFVRSETPPPPPPSAEGAPALSSASAGPAQPVQLTPEQVKARDLAERRKRAPVLIVKDASGGGEGSGGAQGAAGVTTGADGGLGQGSPHSTLGDALSATRMAAVTASRLKDPNLMITQGQFLDCNLVTAINSDQPGMTSCMLARDVYSTNGRVLLLERGSRLVGQYQSAQLRQGQKRIFVMWTRAETPQGVVINLDSPSTDPVGRSGVDGKITTHFWARFGSALLLSLVDDISAYEEAKQQSGGGTTLSFGSTASSGNTAASIIVQNTVNIPPTLDKAQGGHIGVFVARDLYFGDVYALSDVQQ